MAQAASPWLAALPLAGISIVIVACVLLARRHPEVGLRKRWASSAAVACLTVLVLAAVWCARGLYEGDVWSMVGLSLVSSVCCVLSLCRIRVAEWLVAQLEPHGRLAWRSCTVLAFVALAALAFLALELSWNDDFVGPWPAYRFLGMGLIALALVSVHLFSRRRSLGMVVIIVACTAVGISQYFVGRFKGTAILPGDLFALRTAVAVGDKYTYAVGATVAGSLGVACAGAALSALIAATSQVVDQTRRRGLPSAVWATACLVVLVVLVTVPNYIKDLGLHLSYFSSYSLTSYKRNGFLAGFIAAFQSIGVDEPDGYDEDEAAREVAELADTYDAAERGDKDRAAAVAQFEGEHPSIVVVMNETFADLSEFDALREAGYAGPANFKAVDDALLRGDLAVSVLGGGTCNTEFEFLTGNSYAFIGEGKYPYVMYSLAPFDNLARQLSGLGYTCSSMHPNLASNWNRSIVYADMGFDRFYSIDDFADAAVLHSGVSDEATYDKVLELLETDDSPQFIFDVTMQNHSGYDQANMPAALLRHYALKRYEDDEWTSNAIDEYLACIEASDQALAGLMERLAKLDRPVVLVFFGDHHPHFSEWINDDHYFDEDELTHEERIHHTAYFVWANYDVAGRTQHSDVDDTSADTLGAMTLELVGGPLTQLQRARLAVRTSMPALNVFGYEGADGRWYEPDAESRYGDVYRTVERINYLNFGSHV